MRFQRQRSFLRLLSLFVCPLFVCLALLSSGLDTVSGQCVNGQCRRIQGYTIRRSTPASGTTRRYVNRIPQKANMKTPRSSQTPFEGNVKRPFHKLPADKPLSLATLALAGFSPVSLLDQTRWVAGNRNNTLHYQGRQYWFADARQRQAFLLTPDRYTPIAAGKCLVTLADQGLAVPGHVQHTALYQQRIYLFSNRDAKQRFLEHPEHYRSWLERSERGQASPTRRKRMPVGQAGNSSSTHSGEMTD